MGRTAVFWFVAAVHTVRHAVTVARLGETHAEGTLELVLGARALQLILVRCHYGVKSKSITFLIAVHACIWFCHTDDSYIL